MNKIRECYDCEYALWDGEYDNEDVVGCTNDKCPYYEKCNEDGRETEEHIRNNCSWHGGFYY